MKKLLFLLLLLAVSPALHAQEVLLGADFDTYFNNREFGNNPPLGFGIEGESGTTFAARLTPWVGLRWEQKNTLVFGANMLQNFGEANKSFFSEVKPVLYYQFRTEKVRAAAGIFTRDITHSKDYSVAFFTGNYQFLCNRMNGVMAQYNSGASYVEFICDWEGMYSKESREKFRILSSGRQYFNHFYYGYNLTLLHYAHQQDNPNTNIVDFLMVNPCVGVKFKAYFDFDLKLGLLQTMQRDRILAKGWQMPRMGEFSFTMSRWGLSLNEQLFVGQNIYPFFAGRQSEDKIDIPYGHLIYPGTGYLFTAKNVYSCTTLAYSKSFFNDTLGIKAMMLGHYDGQSFGTQQILQVSVRFLKTVYDSRNHKK